MALLINILLVSYVLVAVLMILVILMQRPKSEGLGAAFGGGVTENIFGAQTTNVLTKITSWLATLFFLLTFGLSILYAHKGNTKSELHRELMKDQASAAGTTSPTPSPGPSSTVGQPGAAANPTPASTISTDLSEADATPATSAATPPSSPSGSVKPTGSPESSVEPSTPAKHTPKR